MYWCAKYPVLYAILAQLFTQAYMTYALLYCVLVLPLVLKPTISSCWTSSGSQAWKGSPLFSVLTCFMLCGKKAKSWPAKPLDSMDPGNWSAQALLPKISPGVTLARPDFYYSYGNHRFGPVLLSNPSDFAELCLTHSHILTYIHVVSEEEIEACSMSDCSVWNRGKTLQIWRRSCGGPCITRRAHNGAMIQVLPKDTCG